MNIKYILQILLFAIIMTFAPLVHPKDTAIAKTLDECPSLHEEGSLECRDRVIENLRNKLTSTNTTVIDQIKETDASVKLDIEATVSTFKEANTLWQQSVEMDCKAQYLSVGIGTDKNNQ
jgi:predicted AlkP superfamily phosphohydrolase/phosphomutase